MHVSALGADANSSHYAASKGRGEALVLQHFPGATILRPSIIFGSDDNFYNRIGATRFGPILFMPAANSEVQPVYVEDVAHAPPRACRGRGPHLASMSWAAPMSSPCARSASRCWPRPTAAAPSSAFRTGSRASWARFWIWGRRSQAGLLTSRIMTKDQARTLRQRNRVAENVKTFADLGIEPIAAQAIIGTYLWRFRPRGNMRRSPPRQRTCATIDPPQLSLKENGLSYVNDVLLGIIGSITEFLPISSTGHLLLAEQWLGALGRL